MPAPSQGRAIYLALSRPLGAVQATLPIPPAPCRISAKYGPNS